MKNHQQIASYVVLLGGTLVLGLMGLPVEMGLSIVAGSIALAFLNIDKISKFKGAGFEAEMREQITAIVNKETEPEIDEGKIKAGINLPRFDAHSLMGTMVS